MIHFLHKTLKIVNIQLFGIFCIFLHKSSLIAQNSDTLKVPNTNFTSWMKLHTNAKYALDGNYSSGNVNRQLISNKLTFNYHYKVYEFNISASHIYGKQNLIKTENDFFSGITTNIWHKSTAYIWGMASSEKSFSRGTNHRENIGAGVGFNLIPYQKNRNLSVTYGYLYENTDFIILDDIETVRISTRIRGRHSFLRNYIQLFHETFIQPSIVAADNYRWRTNISLEIPLTKYINFKSGYQYIYENVVNPGKRKEDNNLTFGLTFSY